MLHKEIQPLKSKKYREYEYDVNNGVGILFPEEEVLGAVSPFYEALLILMTGA